MNHSQIVCEFSCCRDALFVAQVNPMRGPGSKPSLLFKLLIPATAIFIVTILSMIAILFSDERAPVAIFLNRHGNSLLAAEFVAVMVLSFLAMAVDRLQTLRLIGRDHDGTAHDADAMKAGEDSIGHARPVEPPR
jgi:hypothetical protein